jgi:hypothetical protein
MLAALNVRQLRRSHRLRRRIAWYTAPLTPPPAPERRVRRSAPRVVTPAP